jgi:uncharacterized protein (DUF2267 family)
MTTTGVEGFDRTVHKTNLWLKEIQEELGWEDRQRAYLALRAALHALRDRLTVEEAAELGAQLPMLIRGLYFEGWHPTGKPVKERHKADFLRHIEEQLRIDFSAEPEAIARAVFRVLDRNVSAGEMADVRAILPAEIRGLLPQSEPAVSE